MSPLQPRTPENPLWIYPLQVLEIKCEITKFSEQEPRLGVAAHFMNLHMTIREQSDQDNFLFSKFDKRRELPFNYTQYIVFHSNRPVKQSYSIVVSQTVSILYLSSTVTAASLEIKLHIDSLVRNGFNRKKLLSKVTSLLQDSEFPGVKFNISELKYAIGA